MAKVKAMAMAKVSASATTRPADRQRSRCYEFRRILQ
jgi:hypothetical protein